MQANRSAVHGRVIALFEFGRDEKGIGVTSEKHYKLVPPDEITDEDLAAYRNQKPGS